MAYNGLFFDTNWFLKHRTLNGFYADFYSGFVETDFRSKNWLIQVDYAYGRCVTKSSLISTKILFKIFLTIVKTFVP